MAYQCQKYTGAVFCEKEYPEFDDPIQGNVQNCSFIASLSSVVWVTNIIAKLATSSSYNVLGSTVSEDLWLDPTKNPSFAYARSKDQSEIWPGIYEKAYAKNCDASKFSWPPTAKNPLGDLTGCQKRDPLPVSFGQIVGLCYQGKTVRPMVIHTNTTISEGPDQMKPDHAYSVLGHTKINTIDYLVLRNPLGIVYTGYSNTNVNLTNTWTVNDTVWDCKNPSKTSPLTSRGPKTIQFGQNGIFAIKASVLGTYFSSYIFSGYP